MRDRTKKTRDLSHEHLAEAGQAQPRWILWGGLANGENVSVTVIDVHGNRVRLGIPAPKTVAVHREEVFNRIAEENRVITTPQESPS
jgi:carbon storage regulator